MTSKVIQWSIRRVLVPAAILALTGCAAIEAQKLAGDGARLQEKGELDKAEEVYRQSLAKSENDVAHAGLAEIHLRRGAYGDAAKEAAQAIVAAGDSGMSYTSYGYRLILARAQLLQGRGSEAYETTGKVVRELSSSQLDAGQAQVIKRTLKDALLLQARIVEATGNPAEALKIIEDGDVQVRYPDDLDFKADGAIVAALTGNYDTALAKADQVLAAHPNDGDAKLAKGIVLAMTGKLGSTGLLLKDALADDHTRALVFMRVPEKLRSERKNEEALEVLKLIADVQPNNPVVQLTLAFVYMDMRMVDPSIEAHLKALEVSPTLSPYHRAGSIEAFAKMIKDQPLSEFDKGNLEGVYLNLAVLHREKKDLDRVISSLERAIAINPTVSSYQDLAITYREQKNTEKMVSTLEKMLELDPNNINVLKTLGQELITVDLEKATRYFRRAGELKPDDTDVMLGLGVGLFNAKKFDEARIEFEQIVKLKPNDADVVYYLALAQLSSGQKDAAETNFKRVIELNEGYADAYRELGNLARDRKNFKLMEKYYNLEDKYRGKK